MHQDGPRHSSSAAAAQRRSWSSSRAASTPSADHSDVEYMMASPNNNSHNDGNNLHLQLSPMRLGSQCTPLVEGNDAILEAKPKAISPPPTNTTTTTASSAPGSATPAAAAASKILFLDGLRGLAAMMVVVQHGGYMGLMVGQPAVDIFFVLSAFLLTMIFEKKARTLIKEKANAKRWGWALLDYFARRFLRVYPLFALCAIYLNFYSPAQKEKLFFVHHPEEWNLFKVLVFDFPQRYHVFWTLPLEITYYFMIPVFAVVILVLKKFWLLPLLPLGYLVTYSGLYWIRTDHQGLKPHLPTFIVGSMAAIVYAKADIFIKSRGIVLSRWFYWAPLRVIEMVTLAVLFSVFFNGLFFNWIAENPVPQTKEGGRFVSATASIIIVCEMLLPGAISSVLEWSLLRFAGKVSFSMYLLHSFVLYSDFIRRQEYYYDRFFAIWGLTFVVSTASYYAIEYPGQKLATHIGKLIKQRDMAEKKRMAMALPVTSPVLQTV